MTIEFATPNGSMKIFAETFFEQQTIPKIRKMLKCFRNSFPEEGKILELKQWLSDKSAEEKQKEKDYSDKHDKEQEQLPVKENYYQYLRTFCDDKNKVRMAMEDARGCKIRMKSAISTAVKAARMAERYKSILGDASKILVVD